MSNELQADYLVVGAGAMGMAFVDVLLAETDATVVLVDRRARPGGHWNDSYPFVRLHQPSAFYGVNSKELGSGMKDQTGLNQGLFELASGTEVVAYYDQVLHQDFLPSGRVQYFPMSNYTGNGTFVSQVSGQEFRVMVNRKVVDATYMNVTVPSMRPPAFAVDEDATCVAVNDLPAAAAPGSDYVVVGAGKTGIDAVLWLLANDCPPDSIRWVMPRDSWLWNRANIQPGEEFVSGVLDFVVNQMESAAAATSLENMWDRLEQTGNLMRLDPDVMPTMWRCATVTTAELAQLRLVTKVIRQGRVTHVGTQQLTLENGTVSTSPSTIHVDCSADGLERRPPVPVFTDEQITLQAVRTCQQVFSAALIAHVEASYSDQDQQNQLCTPVPHPNSHLDWMRSTIANGLNSFVWGMDEELTNWLESSRLDAFSITRRGSGASEEQQALLARAAEAGPVALEKLNSFLADFPEPAVPES